MKFWQGGRTKEDSDRMWFKQVESLKASRKCRLFSPDLFVLTLRFMLWFVCRLWARHLIPLSCGVWVCKIKASDGAVPLRRVYEAECIPVKKSLKARVGHFSDMRRWPIGGEKKMVECFYGARERGEGHKRGKLQCLTRGDCISGACLFLGGKQQASQQRL